MNHSVKSISTALAAALLIAVGASGTVANASDPGTEPPVTSSDAEPDAAPVDGSADVDPGAAAAMADERGISVAEATNRLGQQRAHGDKAAKLEKSLAGRSGGSYIDADGNLVVTTLDAAADVAVIEGGASPKRVDDSSARLDHIMRQLNKQAERGVSGGLQGWYVDVPSNTVVLTVTEGANDAKTQAMTKLAAKFGASVRVEYASADLMPTSTEWMVGGYEYLRPNGGSCSVGFNTVDSANRPVVLTAGHCLRTGETLSRNGYWIGNTRSVNYPVDDFGTFWNSYPTYWKPSASVSKYNGTFMTVKGSWGNPPVGTTVCKSGRTTYWTCGTIIATNQTIVLDSTHTVYQTVRHTACVERGDSGGSNISTGGFALGITSAASMTADFRCRSKVGQQNISYYQPIVEALNRNGLRLVVA